MKKATISAAVLAVVLSIGLLLGPQPAGAQEANFGQLFPSVMRIAVVSDEGITLGSGVVISRDGQGSYVITNFHVIAEASQNSIKVLAPKDGTTAANGAAEVEEFTATYWGGDPATDLAILKVRGFFRAPLPLATLSPPENMAIRALGYPVANDMLWQQLNRTPALRDGIVSTTVTAPWTSGLSPVGQIAHTADLDRGMSGGPLADLCGRVIGINTAYNRGSNNSNLALSAADITPFLRSKNLAFTEVNTPCDPQASQRAEAAAQTARVERERTERERQQREAEQQERQRQTQMAWMIGAGVLVLALIGGAIALIRRRAGRSAPASSGGGGAPPHGLLLRGTAEAAGSNLVLRAEDIAVDGGAPIGRSSTFGSPHMGRQHARLGWSPSEGFVVRDLGAVNGTRVNGVEIKGLGDKPIRVGDLVEFGASDARFTIEKL